MEEALIDHARLPIYADQVRELPCKPSATVIWCHPDQSAIAAGCAALEGGGAVVVYTNDHSGIPELATARYVLAPRAARLS